MEARLTVEPLPGLRFIVHHPWKKLRISRSRLFDLIFLFPAAEHCHRVKTLRETPDEPVPVVYLTPVRRKSTTMDLIPRQIIGAKRFLPRPPSRPEPPPLSLR